MDKIYLLHGAAQSGKNTCADYIKNYYEATYNKRVCIVAFADYIKYVLDKYYSTPFERTEEYRTRIQHFGTEQGRKVNEFVWTDIVRSFIDVSASDFDVYILPDWRFINECTRLEEFYSPENVIKINIKRPDVEEVDNMTEEQRNHASERELDKFKNFDYNIINETSHIQQTIQQIADIIDEVENSDSN